ncbi:NAD(P)H-quinone oxidoreductase subunit S, chloroplastic-like [Abrus precatorius]|uniref:NAD(P)H-quinone oxidoreductase subunit S, chloroplastic-like n=1 Tax=Abrus precatorius TaxID=3816 RepID=A0A8B8L987_ABRPR|nr:NAD(P)H-quinone oxidoreductase subunit S, chloroplastic-like [Abrus precatorius]
MGAFATLHGLNDTLFRSQFLGQHHHLTPHFSLKRPPWTQHHRKPTFEVLKPCAKFNILEMMGGRGLCNGEKGLQQELERQIVVDDKPQQSSSSSSNDQDSDGSVGVPEDAFEKEMMGLTGGFPGGEKGLIKFIEKNPPPKPQNVLTHSL